MYADSMPGKSVEATDGDELLAAAMGQLDDGADFIKLYLDGPDPAVSPWTAAEVRRVVAAVHARGAQGDRAQRLRWPAHARARRPAWTRSSTASSSTTATARIMAANGVRLVSTLCVLASWRTFGQTTTLPRFASDEGRAKVEARREAAMASVAAAHRAGVAIATGTDFGGGSTRANQLAWEVEQLVEAGLAAVGGPRRSRHVARRRAAGRARRRRHPGGRAGGPRARPRRPGVGSHRAVARVARVLDGVGDTGIVIRPSRTCGRSWPPSRGARRWGSTAAGVTIGSSTGTDAGSTRWTPKGDA